MHEATNSSEEDEAQTEQADREATIGHLLWSRDNIQLNAGVVVMAVRIETEAEDSLVVAGGIDDIACQKPDVGNRKVIDEVESLVRRVATFWVGPRGEETTLWSKIITSALVVPNRDDVLGGIIEEVDIEYIRLNDPVPDIPDRELGALDLLATRDQRRAECVHGAAGNTPAIGVVVIQIEEVVGIALAVIWRESKSCGLGCDCEQA